jgi:ABC-type polysaccharide/polyol phosphate export permease
MYHVFQYERDRQCVYNVTSRRARETIVVVENQYVLLILSVCVCILALFIRPENRMRLILLLICGLPACTLFFLHYLINNTIFGNSH